MNTVKLSLFIVMLLFSTVSWAQDENGSYTETGRFELGAALVVKPEFEGSDKSELAVYPVINYNGEYIFVSSLRGVGYKLLNNDRVSFGPLLSWRFGRDEDDSKLLKGMGDVDGGLEAGAYGRLHFTPQFSLVAEFLHGLGDAKGYNLTMGLAFNDNITEDWSYSLGTSAQYADKKYNSQFFGINHEQSLKSTYDFYQPNGGIKHVAFAGSLNYDFNTSVGLKVFGEYKRLTGPAADSPLVKAGSHNQASSGVALVWRP